jgi:hypothetical protein
MIYLQALLESHLGYHEWQEPKQEPRIVRSSGGRN